MMPPAAPLSRVPTQAEPHMKVSKATALAHREALLSAASTLYRQRGFEAVSVADIGASAGLTHGALYGHFASKEILQAEAVRQMFGWTAEQVRNAPNLTALFELYLSPAHVENPGAGCPFAALGGDTARQPQNIRDEFGHGLDTLIEAVSDLAGRSPNGVVSRQQAISAISSMIGAVILARSSGDPMLKEEVLAAARVNLTAHHANGP